MNLKSDPSVVDFNDLIEMLYSGKDNPDTIEEIAKYIENNRKKYCLVHLYILSMALKGYRNTN